MIWSDRLSSEGKNLAFRNTSRQNHEMSEVTEIPAPNLRLPVKLVFESQDVTTDLGIEGLILIPKQRLELLEKVAAAAAAVNENHLGKRDAKLGGDLMVVLGRELASLLKMLGG
jgi:hypothetical protein